jgi:probable HAF family extracellular repeat protein
MARVMKTRWKLTGLLALTSSATLTAASFEVLPASADFIGMGQVGALNVNGSVLTAAGWSLASWSPQAVKWTSAAGVSRVESATPLNSGAAAISADGTVIAGWRFDPDGRATCWINGSRSNITSFRNSEIKGLDRNGTTAVGRNPANGKSSYYGVAAKWAVPGGTVTSLGDLAGGATQSEATRISADGSTIVGWGTGSTGVTAFRAAGGAAMVSLGDLTGGRVFSEALGVSADGTVVVGRSESTNGLEAFRWTSAGMVGLGDLPGGPFQSSATGVSGDGQIVVGVGASEADNEVFVWDAARGMRSLAALCSAAGLPVSGYRFTYCRPVISEDGDSIAGDAIAPDQTQVLWKLGGLRALLGNVPAPPVSLALDTAGITLRFTAEAGFFYQLQQCQGLESGGWINVGDPIPGDGVEHILTPGATGTPRCFFRLVVTNKP